MHSEYDRVVAELFAQNEFAIKYDLDAMLDAVERLECARTARVSVIVAGTNGKGAVCALLHGIAMAAGWRVGLFTSPHLVELRERMRINAVPLAREQVAEHGAEMLRRFGGRSGPPQSPRALSYFELVTLIAARSFAGANERLDLAIWEVGLGGRLDATNALDHDIAAVTSVALDHQQYLGSTLDEIAHEKAAVARPGRPLVVHPQADGAEAIAHAAARTGAEVVQAPADGCHVDRINRALATTVARCVAAELGETMTPDCIARGLDRTQWPGRRQSIDVAGRRWLVDGGHNPAATRRVGAWLARELAGVGPIEAITAMSPGRALHDVLAPLAPHVSHATCVPASAFRTVSPAELADAWRSLGVPASVCDEPAAAFAAASEATTLVAGSLYLAGALFGWLGYDADDLAIWTPPDAGR